MNEIVTTLCQAMEHIRNHHEWAGLASGKQICDITPNIETVVHLAIRDIEKGLTTQIAVYTREFDGEERQHSPWLHIADIVAATNGPEILCGTGKEFDELPLSFDEDPIEPNEVV